MDEGITEVIEQGMYCRGCRGDRSLHWSPDCPILLCCVDERHLEHCAQCKDFLCETLEAFTNDGQTQHEQAVEHLRRIAGSPQ